MILQFSIYLEQGLEILVKGGHAREDRKIYYNFVYTCSLCCFF